MTRYRNRTLKASAGLWLIVLLADAGWVVSSGAAAVAATVLAVCVIGAAALIARAMLNVREPEPVPVRVRTQPQRRL